jgi:hypothetical protein
MENKNIHKVIDSVFKTLRLPSEHKFQTSRLTSKFTHHKFSEINIRKDLDKRTKLNLDRLVYPKKKISNTPMNQNTKLKTKGYANLYSLENFDILSPVEKKIKDLETENRIMNTKFNKAIHEMKNFYKNCKKQSLNSPSSIKFKFPKNKSLELNSIKKSRQSHPLVQKNKFISNKNNP